MKQKHQAFHLSIGVQSLTEADEFFVAVLGGTVTHRDPSGYINVEVFGSQFTLKNNPNIQVTLPDFYFGFNMTLTEFNELSEIILAQHTRCVEMQPKVGQLWSEKRCT